MKLPQDVHTMLLRTMSAITMTLLLATSVIPDSAWAASAIQEANAALEGKGENDIFESASNVKTNLEGWQLKGSGNMEQTAEGLRLSSDSSENAAAISATRADDFVYEADVMITDMQADASLVFRSSVDGWSSYMLQIVPSAGLVRLKDAREGNGRLKVEKALSLSQGEIVHLKVKVVGSNIKVFWGNQYEPIMEVDDTAYSTGQLGLHVWDGSALFQNIKVSEWKGNLFGPVNTSGDWQPDIKGLKGSASEGLEAYRIYKKAAADYVLEGNITLGGQAEAGFYWRGNDQGTEGYEAIFRREDDQVRVTLETSDGKVIGASSRTYPSLPTSVHHVEIHVSGDRTQVTVDGYEPAAIRISDGSYADGSIGMKVKSGTAYFQDVYVTPMEDYYTEEYRPQYHYSPIRGSVSDPNGLVYFEGEYHLFHQDAGQWAHAVSRDLLHWNRLPIALPWNDLGHVWSGSAVADTTNASGLFGDSGGKGLIAYYTSFNPDRPGGNQKIGLAYSTDHGRTWTYSKERPILIENPGKQGEDPGGWDFRDPKVVRDEANNRWIMVVSGGDHIRFYTSDNLVDWSLTDRFGYGEYIRGGVWECPDLFQLAVDGSGQRKWVLMISSGANPNTQGSDAEYFIGDVTPDGKFMNDHTAGTVLRTDWGKEFYASMSFSDLPDNRRIMLAWMTNWDYPFSFPTSGWKGQLTIPRELSLRTTSEGIRLHQSPISELETLRNTVIHVNNREVTETSQNVLKGIQAGAFEIEAEVEIPTDSSELEFGFRLRKGGGQQTVVGYNNAAHHMFIDRSASGTTDFSSLFSTEHKALLHPIDGVVKLRIYVDESSVEVFGNDGNVVFSDVIFPDRARRGMSFYTQGGQVKLKSLQVHALDSVWRHLDLSEPASRILLDSYELDLSQGETESLYAAVDRVQGNGKKPLVWSSSHPGTVRIVSSDETHAVLKALNAGEAVITASTPNGKISASTRVLVSSGTFKTNLTGWKPDLKASKWVLTEHGIRGSHSSDANYMAQEKAGDFTFEGDMRLGEAGGAGSMLFRASGDGRSGYYLNLDPGMKAIRLFYMVEGRFEERQVLARVPGFIQGGRTYHLRIEAKGPHIQVDVDGKTVIDVMDGTFAEGHFGVNVFGGQASYQNVYVRHSSEARLRKTSFMNEAMNQVIYTEKSVNGEPVTVKESTGTGNPLWVLVPTGEDDTYSIRTPEGKALDVDTGQNRIQLYTYLGYNNQRWRVERQEDDTVTIRSVHDGRAIAVRADGSGLEMNEPDAGSDRQRWRLGPEAKGAIIE
jgi:levanbiose-producing levanase